MIALVTCTGCQKAGVFDIELVFDPKHDRCKSCGHEQDRKWRFYFCILSCFADWMKENKVAELGIPCRDCYNHQIGKASGFSWGFEQNGICKTCDGKKVVKGRLVAEDPFAGIKPQVGSA